MKKLHSLAFCALVTPVITLGATSVLAQQSTDQDTDHGQQSTQHEQGGAHYEQGDEHSTPATADGAESTAPGTTEDAQTAQRTGQPELPAAADGRNERAQAQKENRGYLESAPADAMQTSTLIGANVKTTTDEDVGSVNDLIIDEDGQIVAIVVGVGGFLGMGERDIAIGWDDVTKSDTADEFELQIDATREELSAAPEFKAQD